MAEKVAKAGIKRECVMVLAVVSFSFSCSALAEESITIATYYPSPQGVYKTLKAKRMAIGPTYYQQKWVDEGGSIPDNVNMTVEGDVGIGTQNPSDRLTVSGDIRVGELNLVSDPGATSIPGYGKRLYFSGGPAIGANSNTGENSDVLWIARYNAAWDETELRINIGDNPVSNFDSLTMGNTDFGSGNWNPLMTVRSDGNVGIGTTSPQAKLHVNGTMIVNGSMYANNSNWTEVSTSVGFASGWSNNGSPYWNAQYKRVGDLVFIRGAVYRVAWSGIVPIFTLPAGFRPAKKVAFITSAIAGTEAHIAVTSGGVVEHECLGYCAGGLTLDGIVFSTD